MLRSTRAQFLSVVFSAAAVALTAHCGGDTTGRERTTFRVTVRGQRAEGDTSVGWHVAVERAAIAVGPVRWYEGEPLFGARMLRALRFGTAEADPGHYVPGEALADVTSQRAVDLMDPAGIELDRANGVTGTANSAALELRAPRADLGPAGAILNGHTLTVRGVATRGAEIVRFEAFQDLDLEVSGVPARGAIRVGPGRWDLAVDLVGLLDRADFSTLPAVAPGEYAQAPADGQVSNALNRAATSGAHFHFTWLDDGRDL